MARREVSIFSMSFLDVIFCGFGSVVLLFVIINARAAAERRDHAADLSSEVRRIQTEILDQKKDLFVVQNSLETTEDELVETQGAASRIAKTLEEKKLELAEYENETLASEEHVNQLKADIESLEESYQRLKAAALESEGGTSIKAFSGDGDRQYLTGLKVGGQRILILVDASASMLGERVVDVIIRRNLPDATRKASEKWQQAVSTVDWLTTQFPAGSTFQLVTFNEEATPVLPGSSGAWLKATDPVQLRDAMAALRDVIPQKGTSLHNAFEYIDQLSPSPDNLFLLTDGLPTMGAKRPGSGRVSGERRYRHFRTALIKLPQDLPVNVILYPMEGDPMAASAFWRLAVSTRGSFLSPSEDWP